MQVNQISVQGGLQANVKLDFVKALKHELFSKILFALWGNVFFTFSRWMNLWVEFPPCKKVLYRYTCHVLSMELTLYWTCYIPLKQHNKLDTVSLRKFKVSRLNLFLLIQQFPLIIWLRRIIQRISENNCVPFRSCQINVRCISWLI